MTWTDRGLIAALTRLLPVRRRSTPARPHPHQDKRHAEELKAAADDLLSRLDQ